jgi:hypothetical protein
MAGVTPRPHEQYYHYEEQHIDFNVNEIAADQAGGLSPFGADVEFPLPIDKITYVHPTLENRPNLAGGR